jgi:hypothetical protein
LRGVLEEQIASNDPPETASTFARLTREGMSEDRVWRMLSAVLLQELNAIVAEEREFDLAAYVAALHRLPELVDR